jgi:hypothetical protein
MHGAHTVGTTNQKEKTGNRSYKNKKSIFLVMVVMAEKRKRE